jgi:hypothetical protein
VRLLGISINDDDARRLTATLLADGTPDALTAAEQITKGVERDLYAVGLSRAERCSPASKIRPTASPSCAGCSCATGAT